MPAIAAVVGEADVGTFSFLIENYFSPIDEFPLARVARLLSEATRDLSQTPTPNQSW